MKKVLVTTSWDDGSIFDLKLAGLLTKYKIPATFYTSIKNPELKMLKAGQIRDLSDNFEIGGHTYNHCDLKKTPLWKVRKEILDGKKAIEDIISKKISSFCYPYGAFNQKIKQEVGFCGFNYARTVSTFATSIGDILLSPTTLQASNHNLFSYSYRGGIYGKLFFHLIKEGKIFSGWDILAKESLEYCIKRGGIYHLWGHSWEIEKNNDWEKLESVLDYIARRTNIDQRVSNGDLAEKLQSSRYEYYSNINVENLHLLGNINYFQKELAFLEKITRDFDQSGKRILDIGCGTGRVSELFNKANYLGVDYSENFIKFAKKEYPEANKKFISGNAWKIDRLGFTKYDLIFLWGILESETKPLDKIKDVIRYAKKGTRVIISLNNGSNFFFKLSKYIRCEFFEQPFSFTSYTNYFMEQHLMPFCKKFGFKFQILSFGIVPPSVKIIPAINYKNLGAVWVVILDKK